MPRTPLCVIGGYSAGLEMPPLRPNTTHVVVVNGRAAERGNRWNGTMVTTERWPPQLVTDNPSEGFDVYMISAPKAETRAEAALFFFRDVTDTDALDKLVRACRALAPFADPTQATLPYAAEK
jgi:hypothetical protein